MNLTLLPDIFRIFGSIGGGHVHNWLFWVGGVTLKPMISLSNGLRDEWDITATITHCLGLID